MGVREVFPELHAVAVTVRVEEAVKVGRPEVEGGLEGEEDRESGLAVGEGEREAVGQGVEEAEEECEAQVVLVGVNDGVTAGLCVALVLVQRVGEGEGEALCVPRRLGDDEREGEAEELPLWEWLGVALPEELPLALAEMLTGVALRAADGDAVGERLGRGEGLTDKVADREPAALLRDAGALGLLREDLLSEGDTVEEIDADAQRLADSDVDCVFVAELHLEEEREPVALRAGEAVLKPLELKVRGALAEGDLVEEGDTEALLLPTALGDCVLDTEVLLEEEGEPVALREGEAVLEPLELKVRGALAEGDLVGEGDTEALLLPKALGDCVLDTELLLEEEGKLVGLEAGGAVVRPLELKVCGLLAAGDIEMEGDTEALLLPKALGDCVYDAELLLEGEGEPVALAQLALADSVLLTEKVAEIVGGGSVFDTVGETRGEREADCDERALVEGALLLEALGQEVPLAERDGVIEELTLVLGEGVAQGEAETLALDEVVGEALREEEEKLEGDVDTEAVELVLAQAEVEGDSVESELVAQGVAKAEAETLALRELLLVMEVQADTLPEDEVEGEVLGEEVMEIEEEVDTVGVVLALSQFEREGDSVVLSELVREGVAEMEEEMLALRELLLVMEVQADTLPEDEVVGEVLREEVMDLEKEVDTVGVVLALSQPEREGDSVVLSELVSEGVAEMEEETLALRELLLVMEVQTDTLPEDEVVGEVLREEVMDLEKEVDTVGVVLALSQPEREGDSVALCELVWEGVAEMEEETLALRELLLVMEVQAETLPEDEVVGEVLREEVMDLEKEVDTVGVVLALSQPEREGDSVVLGELVSKGVAEMEKVGRGDGEEEGDTDGEGLEDGCEAEAE